MQIPLLFLSDSPSLLTGLGRITRELVCHLVSMPEYRVGVLGRGGLGSAKLPFAQYVFPEMGGGWGETAIEQAWRDFAGKQKGVLFTINDASRLAWLAHPDERMGTLYDFLMSKPFKRVGYFPIDSSGPGDKLTRAASATIAGFDTPLAYTAWGAQVIERSIGRAVDWIPHGYNGDVFQPRDRAASRMALGMGEDEVLVGVNMTNQSRKDWGVAFAAIAGLKQKRPVRFWVHVDVLERHWSIPALAHDFGLDRDTVVSFAGSKTDTELSYYYSAADLTILPSHEGFGLTIVESLACGTPCIHGDYGGGAELIPNSSWLVRPQSWRLDTPHNLLRPVFEPGDWIDAIERVLAAEPSREECTTAVQHLRWSNLWPGAWRKFFEELCSPA
jgi:glycosyltransferase involved in cell wall biosynthesis